jgi:diphthamide synthase (EF-2-diphthine--ammonia ligase)
MMKSWVKIIGQPRVITGRMAALKLGLVPVRTAEEVVMGGQHASLHREWKREMCDALGLKVGQFTNRTTPARD